MPFPLAHPAAVLPLKRFCPHWLSLPALVIGSVVPDAAYLLSKLRFDSLAHHSIGIVEFSLPAGLLLTYLVYGLRRPLVARLPGLSRGLVAGRWQPVASPLALIASVMLGAATHVAWDSVTHQGGWTVQQVPQLATVITTVAGYNVRLCRLLWYGSSFLGTAMLYLSYNRALRNRERSGVPAASELDWVKGGLVACLVIPIELVHELVRGAAGGMVVALLSALLVAGVLWMSQTRAGLDKPPSTR